MNTEPVVFKIDDDTVQLKPEPTLRRFTISKVLKNTAGEKTTIELGYLCIHNFPSRTPVYLPDECAYELITFFGNQSLGILIKRCEEIVQRNGHVRPLKRP